MVDRYRPKQRKRWPEGKPFKWRTVRSSGRRALLRALGEEYEFGNSVSKLYVALLARAMLQQEPSLIDEAYFRNRCGLDVLDSGKTTKKVNVKEE
jgi:hypothetical protein